ncbi:hypothetical protein FRB95_012981 [Tulasnella sp. JGI-2019a]|nr:hypothetical protein FRB95_012981 [Tulasnella sp. JGI-2019a]
MDTDTLMQWLASLAESKMSDPCPLHLAVHLLHEDICLAFVETVLVRDHGTEPHKFLSSPIDLGNDEYGWPGPNMRKIVFTDSQGLDAEVMIEVIRRRMTASRGADHNNLGSLEELVILGQSSIAKISSTERKAGKQQMTSEEVVKAVQRIVATEACEAAVTRPILRGVMWRMLHWPILRMVVWRMLHRMVPRG